MPNLPSKFPGFQFFAGLVVFIHAALGTSVASDAADVDAFDRQKARVAFVTERWIISTTTEDPDNPQVQAPAYRTRYFRSKIGGAPVELIHQMSGTYSKIVRAVFDDGTVLLGYFYELDWILATGESRSENLRIDGRQAVPLLVHPDGMLIQPLLYSDAPVYFVPIRDNSLEFERRIRITDEKGVSSNSSRPWFIRHGRLIAWNGTIFDMETQSRRDIEPNGFPATTAIGDDTLILRTREGPLAVSLTTGKRRLLDRPLGDTKHNLRFFAIRDGVGYFFGLPNDRSLKNTIALKSLELWTDSATMKELTTMPFTLRNSNLVYADESNLVYADEQVRWIETDRGLKLWDGQEWRLVEWDKRASK